MFHRDFSGMSEIVPFSHYDVLQCETCGMMFAGNIVESMPLLQYYELMSKYETSAFAKAQELNEVKIGSIQFLLDEISPTDSVIDIGCGEGSLLRSLKKETYRARAIPQKLSDRAGALGNSCNSGGIGGKYFGACRGDI